MEVEVRNLTKKYDNHLAVDDISFSIETGKIYGFLGPNGAGKSTTMNILAGCLAATNGQVLIHNHDIFEEQKEAKRHIGYLPELPPLYLDMTPKDFLVFVSEIRCVPKAQRLMDVSKIMNRTGISEVANRLIGQLSKGYRQRVGIAQALIGNPEVIILDEPTVGLDPAQIIEIRELIRQLGKDHTILLSSHILSEVSELCDEVMILSKGKLVARDTPEKLGEMQKLIDSISQQELKDRVQDLKSSLEQLEDNLDRNLELYKELVLQKEMFETSEKLKELSQKQIQVAEESEKIGTDPKNQIAKQADIRKEFEALQSTFDSLDRQNSELKRDSLSDSFRDNEQKTNNELKKAEENLAKGRNSRAKKNQNEAAEKMQSMSNELNSMLEEEEQESLEESIARLRLILQNVLESSFQQERLLGLTSHIDLNDPGYIQLGSEQRMLMAGLEVMHDSLKELSKRESSIPPFLFSLFRQIDETMQSLLHQFGDRKISAILIGQRSAMTDINNLALLLSEAMSNLQRQSNMNMMSSGSCKNAKPRKGNKGKPSLKSLRQAQEQLNQQLQKMNQLGKSNGNKGEQSQQSGEQFSRLAMEQAMIRRELESYMKSVQDESGLAGEELKKITKDMDKTENDLVYKKLSNFTLERQEKILTRLLESERAEQEREKEERRESKTGIIDQESNPFQKLRYNESKRKGDDVFLREKLKFNSFFHRKVILYEHNTVK
ncbi:MAG: hypothetical protein CVU06_03990 [Bacteroidetes bacterium HGW-Bacteroidetes-22]|nr:MAG: hypothetical protein CVU06_03990 [Bacteroidetes bacterium HGW-Bacteroidetes-22]